MACIMVTGGVRSGKSKFAEDLVARSEKVLYVATGTAWDDEMQDRIAAHQERRPAHWGLLEADTNLKSAVEQALAEGDYDAVLVDCLSTWITRILLEMPESQWRDPLTRLRVMAETLTLAKLLNEVPQQAVVVTTETGLGGVAMTPLGRVFQDLLGEANQMLAEKCRDVYLLVSGRPLRLPPA
jgi:adenosylcobinamide kinase / adenosylcobinamide-phosphate guanylyltransferase